MHSGQFYTKTRINIKKTKTIANTKRLMKSIKKCKENIPERKWKGWQKKACNKKTQKNLRCDIGPKMNLKEEKKTEESRDLA